MPGHYCLREGSVRFLGGDVVAQPCHKKALPRSQLLMPQLIRVLCFFFFGRVIMYSPEPTRSRFQPLYVLCRARKATQLLPAFSAPTNL